MTMLTHRGARRTALVILLSGLPAAARALGTQAAPEPEPVVITASRYGQLNRTVPGVVTVISSAEVKAAPAHALDDVLRNVPGVQMRTISSNIVNPSLQTVSILGLGMSLLGGARSLVMLDGMPLTDGFGGWVPWSMVPTDTVERVEVMLGASSSLYGNNAMGGAISIITRSPKERAADLNFSYGSRNTFKTNAYVSDVVSLSDWFGATPKFGLSIDYNDFRTDGYQWLPTQSRGQVDHNAWARNTTLQVKAASLKGDATGPFWFLRGDAFYEARNFGIDHWFTKRDILEVAGGFHHPLDAGGEVRGQAFYGKHHVDSNNGATNTARTLDVTTLRNDLPSYDSGGSLQWSHPFEALSSSVTLGMDVRNVSGQVHEFDYDNSGNYTVDRSTRATQTNIGFFGQWTANPVPDLIVAPSARVDYWQNHDLHQLDSAGEAALPAKQYAFLSPRLALRYQALESLALRGAVYRAFVAPDINSLYRGAKTPVPGKSTVTTLLPNPNLAPEILDIGGEFGSDLALGALNLRTTLFWVKMKDAISSVIVNSNNDTQPQNVAQVRSRGVVVEAPVRFSRQWSLLPTYTYTDATVISNPLSPTSEGQALADIPRHQASFKISFDDPKIVTARLGGRYLSKRWSDDTHKYSPLDEEFVLDFSASRWVTKDLEVYFDGENLLDRRYTAVYIGSQPYLGEPLYAALGLRYHYR
ncbi:MAG: TonB-dependent receptor [Elusimicrobia bacterium]|nr:TonB-dependent receptor [Elusimicrobiota bacterium]